MQLMSIENIKDIRATINAARRFEQETGRFQSQLESNLDKLHQAIELPNANESAILNDFVSRYIDHVPEFIEAIYKLTEAAGIDKNVEPFLKIAEDYFLKPPEVMAGHEGVDALLDEAYLAHRLMEEINDRFIAQCGIPLAPLDMTRANIIVHSLIGEPFANELDQAVHYAVELLFNNEAIFKQSAFQDYAREHQTRGWSEELAQWPCLAEDLEINLNFEKTVEANSPEGELTH